MFYSPPIISSKPNAYSTTVDCGRASLKASPKNIIEIPREIWNTVFQFLNHQDQYHLSLTCKFWRDLTKIFFDNYRMQVFYCVQRILKDTDNLVPYIIGENPEKSTRSIKNHQLEEVSLLNLDILKKYDNYNPESNLYKQEINLISQAINLISSIIPFSKKMDHPTPNPSKDPVEKDLVDMLKAIKIDMLKYPEHLCFFDLASDLVRHPGYHYTISKMKFPPNLIYCLDGINYASRIRESLKSKKIQYIYFSVGALNYPELMEINKNFAASHKMRCVALSSTISGEKYNDREVCLIGRLSKIMSQFDPYFLKTTSSGIQDADAKEIANYIGKHPNLSRLQFIRENKVTNAGFLAIYEAISRSTTHFTIELEYEKSHLETIEEGINKIRACNNVTLTIFEPKPSH